METGEETVQLGGGKFVNLNKLPEGTTVEGFILEQAPSKFEGSVNVKVKTDHGEEIWTLGGQAKYLVLDKKINWGSYYKITRTGVYQNKRGQTINTYDVKRVLSKEPLGF